jgi:hypothetical protein
VALSLLEYVDLVQGDYVRLIGVLGMEPVPLDIYEPVIGKTNDITSYGTNRQNATPGYDGRKKLIVLPYCGDDLPTFEREVPFPPAKLQQHLWPIWRIDLWHEGIHQLSDVLDRWDPHEPPRRKANGRLSEVGHGVGWFEAMKAAASKFSWDADELDSLLD